MLCIVIENNINSCIFLIHSVINLSVSFKNIYYEFNKSWIYKEKMGEDLADQSCVT